MINILQVGSLCNKTGGPALSLSLQMKGLALNGVSTECIMPPLQDNEVLVGDNLKIRYTEQRRKNIWGYQTVPKYSDVDELKKDFDLFHIQYMWDDFVHQFSAIALNNGIPYIISPRGSLYPQALEIAKWKKKLAWLLYQKKDIEHAACLQATCMDELRYCRDMGIKIPIAILPNPYDCEGMFDKPIQYSDKFRVGYLGRLHFRKRVERLIYAFSDLRDELPESELLIMGSGSKEYEDFLKHEVKVRKLENVVFTGFLNGEEKDKAIRSLSVLAVPSDFENFGNVVSDALSRGVPVIASKGMPWECLPQNECGWWIENDQKTINKTILEASKLQKDDLVRMGKNGQHYVKENFSVDVLGKKLSELYRWILGEGEKPDFVYLA